MPGTGRRQGRNGEGRREDERRGQKRRGEEDKARISEIRAFRDLGTIWGPAAAQRPHYGKRE